MFISQVNNGSTFNTPMRPIVLQLLLQLLLALSLAKHHKLGNNVHMFKAFVHLSSLISYTL
jgi:hypothetical protein